MPSTTDSLPVRHTGHQIPILDTFLTLVIKETIQVLKSLSSTYKYHKITYDSLSSTTSIIQLLRHDTTVHVVTTDVDVLNVKSLSSTTLEYHTMSYDTVVTIDVDVFSTGFFRK